MIATPGTTALTSSRGDLLRAAYGAGENAIAAWRRWRDGIDWDAHLDPDAFRLMPTVGRNLRRLDCDDPLIPRFAGIARQAWYANQHRLRRYQPVLRALASAHARLAPLPPDWLMLHDASAVLERSASLAFALHGSSVDAATRCLWRTGWRPCVQLPRWSLGGYVLVASDLAWQDDRGQVLVLAWQRDVRDPDGPFPDEAWARARPARLANEPVFALATADAVRELCRRPPEGDAFGAAVELLLHLDAAKPDGTDFQRWAGSVPVDSSWRPIIDELRMILPGMPGLDATHATPSRDPRPLPSSANPGLRARLATHWSAYRRAWGSDYSWLAAVLRLPGYLMARWQLATPRQLPLRFWKGLRYEWRESRRGRWNGRRRQHASDRNAR